MWQGRREKKKRQSPFDRPQRSGPRSVVDKLHRAGLMALNVQAGRAQGRKGKKGREKRKKARNRSRYSGRLTSIIRQAWPSGFFCPFTPAPSDDSDRKTGRKEETGNGRGEKACLVIDEQTPWGARRPHSWASMPGGPGKKKRKRRMPGERGSENHMRPMRFNDRAADGKSHAGAVRLQAKKKGGIREIGRGEKNAVR